MQEGFETSNLEHEIEELSKEIENKREVLEREKGIVEEKEILRHVVGEKLGKAETSTQEPEPSEPTSIKPARGESYLDTLDEDSQGSVNELVEYIPKKGLANAIEEAKKREAFIIDAFHDVLVDKLYDSLKEKGLLK